MYKQIKQNKKLLVHFLSSTSTKKVALTEGGTYPQLPTQPKIFVYCNSSHPELPCEENQNLNSRKKSSV